MLYIVGTPIGNLKDISPRAVQTLIDVDLIACEDTRQTGLLLQKLGIKKRLLSYHEHNRAKREEELIGLLEAGSSIALVSDAGMPCLSDPGATLIDKCYEKGLSVAAIPGPTAAITALALSGFEVNRFHFEGFLPASGAKRKARLLALSAIEDVLVLYEAPHRLQKTIADLCAYKLASRKIALSRELTKTYETTVRFNLCDLPDYLVAHPPRGEYTLVIDASKIMAPAMTREAFLKSEAIRDQIEQLEAKGYAKRAIAKQLASQTNMTSKEVYDLIVKMIECS